MILHEEYSNRHPDIRVPVVNYSSSRILLRDDRFGWRLWQIDRRVNRNNPGELVLTSHIPVHNGYVHNRHFACIVDEIEVLDWDKYEDYVFDWISKFPLDAVCQTKEELLLALWEIFSICHDGWIAEKGYHFSAYAALDETKSISARIDHLYTFISRLKDFHQDKFDKWMELKLEVGTCSLWLKKLLVSLSKE